MIYFKQLNVVSQGTADKFPLFVRYVKKQENCAAHYHDFVELCIILSGHGKHLLNEKNPAPIYPGDVLVIPRSTVHRFIDVSPDLSLTNILYIPEKLQLPQLDITFHPGFKNLLQGNAGGNSTVPAFHIPGTSWENIIFLEEKLRKESREHLPGYRFNMLGTFMVLLGELARCYMPFSQTIRESNDNITKVTEHIRNNFKKNIPLNKLCSLSGMSKSPLLKHFKDAIGITPLQYQLHLRISEAATLLNTSHGNVSEIAFQCGFTDSNYFSRQFKRITGMSPSEYRKNNLQTEYNSQKRNE